MGGFEFDDGGLPAANVVTLDELRAMDPALSKAAGKDGAQAQEAKRARSSRPRFYDAKFRKLHKDGSFDEVATPDPALEGPLADSHTHLGSLHTSDLPLARAAAYGVEFICNITDITEDAGDVYNLLDGWKVSAGAWLPSVAPGQMVFMPTIRLSCGCHPHNAGKYNNSIEQALLHKLADGRTSCLGEIGLDYHYDHSPRDVQHKVFRRQVQLAHRTGLPLSLHVREAHDDALAIMDEEGFPEAGTILHCFTEGPDEAERWLERGCHIAVGGAVTFPSSDALREAVKIIPAERLLLETDAPYMTPVPLRGNENGPEYLIFTAAKVAEVRGIQPGPDRRDFLRTLFANATSLLDRGPTPWQLSARS